jgi:hypothetical protein
MSTRSSKSQVYSIVSMPRVFVLLKVSLISCRYRTTMIVIPKSSKQAGAMNSRDFPPPISSTIASAESKPFMIRSNASPYSVDLYTTAIMSAKLRAFQTAFSCYLRLIFSLTSLNGLVGLNTTGGLDRTAARLNLYSSNDCMSAPLPKSVTVVNGVTSSAYFELLRLPNIIAGVISPPI